MKNSTKASAGKKANPDFEVRQTAEQGNAASSSVGQVGEPMAISFLQDRTHTYEKITVQINKLDGKHCDNHQRMTLTGGAVWSLGLPRRASTKSILVFDRTVLVAA